MSTIFLSYSSEQSEAASRIELSLKEDGHTVFRDRSSLPPGEGFDAQIRTAVGKSDLFIFLISRESVGPGRYSITELKFAEQKWGQPAGHVLPVLIEPVPKDAIPAFLRAVTILTPRGNVTAEVAAEVARMSASGWRRLKWRRLVAFAALALVLAGGAWLGLSRYEGAAIRQAQLLAGDGNYAAAWEVLNRASPASSAAREAQEQLAMDWLDNARSSQLAGTKLGSTLGDIANTVLPVLSRGAAAGKGQRSADLLAHMGWADFLRSRDGVNGLDPTKYYRRALEIDPKNVFAHAMWGFDILRRNGPLAEANGHFTIALESKRERDYVRHLQISALLWFHDEALEDEAIRVANDMRKRGEAMPIGVPDRPDASRLWNIYYDRFINGRNDRRKPAFLSVLPPAEHLATFRWLYPEESVSKDKRHLYLAMLAVLQEYSGDRAGALASYRQLPRAMLVDPEAAIRRLSK